jgi:poly(A) polymerase
MHARGVLPVILPEAGKSQIAALERLMEAERRCETAGTALYRLAALLPPVEAVADSVAARLRLSKKDRELLTCLAERTPGDGETPKALAYACGPGCAAGRLLLTGSDPRVLDGWTIPQLPLKGGEIVQRGLAGAEVSRTLRAVEARWIAEGFPARERVQELLDAVLDEGD